MKQIFIISIILFLGCSKNPTLKITDLKFETIEKDAIATNNIDSIYVISKTL